MKLKIATFAMITGVALSVTSCNSGPKCLTYTTTTHTVVVNGKVSVVPATVCTKYEEK